MVSMDTTQPFKYISEEEYQCTLNEASLKKAKEELNEDPKERLNAVKQLLEWMEQQPHLRFQADTVTLLAFLRTAKFSQLRARKMVDGYAKAVCQFHKWFRNLDPLDLKTKAAIDTGYFLPLPKTNKQGQSILLMRMAKVDLTAYTVDDEMKCQNVITLCFGRNENFMVNGYVFVIDCTGMTLKHLTRSNNPEFRNLQKAFQSHFPGRFKAFIYYNAGTFIATILGFFRSFLSKKLRDRILVCDTAESLYKLVDMELLPLEYLPDDYKGPTVGTCDQILDGLKKKLQDHDAQEHIRYITSSDYINVDESKRPEEVPQESFRKLSTD